MPKRIPKVLRVTMYLVENIVYNLAPNYRARPSRGTWDEQLRRSCLHEVLHDCHGAEWPLPLNSWACFCPPASSFSCSPMTECPVVPQHHSLRRQCFVYSQGSSCPLPALAPQSQSSSQFCFHPKLPFLLLDAHVGGHSRRWTPIVTISNSPGSTSILVPHFLPSRMPAPH